MSSHRFLVSLARRSFLSRLGAGAAAFGAVASAERPLQAQAGRFEPASHAQDGWMDQRPGKHRFVLDATSAEGADGVRRFTRNFFVANKTGYGLDPGDLAVMIILRHHATAFAFNDAMWAKYGAPLSDELVFTDPETKRAPTVNVYNHSGETFDSLIGSGVHVAVCGMATRFFAGVVAAKTGGNVDGVYRELVGNMIGNAHVVPAGIVAVSRAQEHGYTFAYVG